MEIIKKEKKKSNKFRNQLIVALIPVLGGIIYLLIQNSKREHTLPSPQMPSFESREYIIDSGSHPVIVENNYGTINVPRTDDLPIIDPKCEKLIANMALTLDNIKINLPFPDDLDSIDRRITYLKCKLIDWNQILKCEQITQQSLFINKTIDEINYLLQTK